MKTPSPDLFELIHTLSKSEKRFFKLFASSEEGKKQYERLFNLISAQSKYNEKLIQEQLRIKGNDLAVKKRYLHNLILERMAVLFKSEEAKVRDLLTRADFLSAKGLYKQEGKVLKHARELAEHAGLSSLLMQAQNKQYRLSWKLQNMPEVERLLEERQHLFSLLANENEYQWLEGRLTMSFSTMGPIKVKGEKEGINKIMQHPLLAGERMALTFNSRLSFYNIFCSYHAATGNIPKAYVFAKKQIALYLAEAEKTRHRTLSFLIVLTNLIHLCNELGKHDEVRYYLDLLAKHSTSLRSERERSWAFFVFHDKDLNYYIQTKQFESALPGLEKLLLYLAKMEFRSDELLAAVLYLKIARVYFGAGKYGKCIRLLNGILNNDLKLKLRQDIECTIRMFYIVAHFEKGNYDLVKHLSRSGLKHQAARKRPYAFETIMLRFFSVQSGKRSPKEIAVQFARLKKDLSLLKNDPYENAPIREFDVFSWIDSKL